MKHTNWALILTLASIPFFGGQAGAQEAKLETPIGSCGCGDGCFTDEVTNVRCTNRGIKFNSQGLPDPSNEMMRGIKATNQQYPRPHAYDINIPARPERAARPIPTKPGAIGIAVNGVPLFDPSTQGPIDHGTGKPSHALDEGELDTCGGHAGRGDDYHYHIAPKCLIDDLGSEHVEQRRQPIGFANDGYPILALGWFNPANNVETRLDSCRGMTDATGRYFYNVKSTPKWDILNCYTGEFQHISRDRWEARRDRTGAPIVGAKARLEITDFRTDGTAPDTCYIMEGRLTDERLLEAPGRIRRIASQAGAIFYCNPRCYAEFFEPEPDRQYRGPVLFYDLITEACPAHFDHGRLALFNPYVGPPLPRKQAEAGGNPDQGPRAGQGPRPPRRGDGPPPPRPD